MGIIFADNVIILGESGSGKTALKELLMGRDFQSEHNPTNGRIEPEKKSVGDEWHVRGKISAYDYGGNDDLRGQNEQSIFGVLKEVAEKRDPVYFLYCVNAMSLFGDQKRRRGVQSRCRADIDSLIRNIDAVDKVLRDEKRDSSCAHKFIPSFFLVLTHYDEWLFKNRLQQKNESDVNNALSELVTSEWYRVGGKEQNILLADLSDSHLTDVQQKDCPADAPSDSEVRKLTEGREKVLKKMTEWLR